MTVTPIRPRTATATAVAPRATRAPRKSAKLRRLEAEFDARMMSAARMQAQIQELEKLQRENREWLLQYMQESKQNHLQLGDFNAYQRSRHNWTYSARLQREMLKIAQDQKLEQAEGVASDKPTIYVTLQFKQAKD